MEIVDPPRLQCFIPELTAKQMSDARNNRTFAAKNTVMAVNAKRLQP